MDNRPTGPTPYEDINLLLIDLADRIRSILGGQFLGFYLYGSLALGDFDPKYSDIDCLVVTEGEIYEAIYSQLTGLHEQISQSGSPWAGRIEAAYIPQEAINDNTIINAGYPQVEKGTSLFRAPLEAGWAFQRYTLRERGVIVTGPEPRTLVDFVEPAEMHQAAAAIMGNWAELSENDPGWIAWVRRRSCLAFIILTLCRMLYSLEMRSVTSKPGAARWAIKNLEPRWGSLIKRSLAFQHEEDDAQEDDLAEMLAFLAYARKRSGFGE